MYRMEDKKRLFLYVWLPKGGLLVYKSGHSEVPFGCFHEINWRQSTIVHLFVFVNAHSSMGIVNYVPGFRLLSVVDESMHSKCSIRNRMMRFLISGHPCTLMSLRQSADTQNCVLMWISVDMCQMVLMNSKKRAVM